MSREPLVARFEVANSINNLRGIPTRTYHNFRHLSPRASRSFRVNCLASFDAYVVHRNDLYIQSPVLCVISLSQRLVHFHVRLTVRFPAVQANLIHADDAISLSNAHPPRTLILSSALLFYQNTTTTMSLATPRILPSHLHAFSPASRPSTSTVRILGSITSIHGDQAVLQSANHETVTLILNRYAPQLLPTYSEPL
jgi:hypothetical protein